VEWRRIAQLHVTVELHSRRSCNHW